jgi:hypothetical protein
VYEQYLNQSRVAQHQQDLMAEGAAERSLRAMKQEQDERQSLQGWETQSEQQEPVVEFPRISRVRRVWQALYSLVSSLL